MPSQPPRLREFIGLGSAIAGLVAGGMVLGWFIDTRAHSAPLFVLVGLAVGIVSACAYSYAKFRKFLKE